MTTVTTTTRNRNNNEMKMPLGWKGVILLGIIGVFIFTESQDIRNIKQPLELQQTAVVAEAAVDSSSVHSGSNSNGDDDGGGGKIKLPPLKPPYYIVQYGPSRTASTFQAQLLNIIVGYKSKQLLQDTQKFNQHAFSMKPGTKRKSRKKRIKYGFVVKTHHTTTANEIIDVYQKQFGVTVSVFTSSSEITSHLPLAATANSTIINNVLHDQTSINMRDCSLCEINNYYKSIFDLSNEEVKLFEEYMKNWEILRQCCGIQQSKYNRYRLHGCNITQLYIDQPTNNYPYCENYILSDIENNIQSFMSKDIEYQNPDNNNLNGKLWSKPGDCKRIDQEIMNGAEMNSHYKFETCDTYFDQKQFKKVGTIKNSK